MFKSDKDLRLFKTLLAASPVKVVPAKLLSIEDDTCTVAVLGSNLVLAGIGLWDKNGPKSFTDVIPQLNTVVLVGSIGNDLSNLGICQGVLEDSIRYQAGYLTLELTESGAFLSGSEGRVALPQNTLADLYQSLTNK